jgi:hypothetical protein
MVRFARPVGSIRDSPAHRRPFANKRFRRPQLVRQEPISKCAPEASSRGPLAILVFQRLRKTRKRCVVASRASRPLRADNRNRKRRKSWRRRVPSAGKPTEIKSSSTDTLVGARVLRKEKSPHRQECRCYQERIVSATVAIRPRKTHNWRPLATSPEQLLRGKRNAPHRPMFIDSSSKRSFR